MSGAGRARIGEVVGTWVITVVLIRLAVSAFPPEFLWGLPLVVVPILFMWMPVWVLRLRGEDPDKYPLAIPALDDRAAWLEALRLAGLLVGIVALPYLVLYHFWQTQWLPDALAMLCDAGLGRDLCVQARRAASIGPEWRFSDPMVDGAWFAQLLGYHLIFVAIPEEMFYRGYVQSRLDEVWTPRWTLFGAPVGWGLVVTSVIFAAGHSVVVFQWWHFAIFFPSLVFGWLRARSGGVMAGAFFHAWSNITVALLDRIYGITVP